MPIRTATGQWRLRAFQVWTGIGVLVLVSAAFWVIARLAVVLTPFVFAALVVFLLRRPVNALGERGMPRGTATALCYLGMAVILTFLGLVVLPPLVSQFVEFLNEFPRYYAAARDLWFQLQVEYTTLEVPAWLEEAAYASRDDLAKQAGVWSSSLASGVVLAGGQLFRAVLNLFLTLTLAFFALRDLPVIKTELLLLGGGKRREDLLEVFNRVTAVVEGWIRGQSLIAVIVGVLTWFGLELLGVPYAAIIGLIAGVTNLIPYLGPVIAGIIAAISAAFVSPWLVLWTVLYIVVLQQLESLFLQPRVMSQNVNLHPVLVVFALLVGASIAGLVGMLLSVPIAGALNAVFVYYFEKHTASELATSEGALFKKPDDERCEDDSEGGPADDCADSDEDEENE